MRFFLDVSYHGAAFHGWQRQINAIGVQQVLEEAMRTILRLPELEVTGSGRTDTGVHASQQIVHVDLPEILSENQLFRINCFLPRTISINSIVPVKESSHARFDAIRREYEYYIHKHKNPFKEGISWLYDRPLDVVAMNEAAGLMLQYEDFQCFSKTHTDVDHYRCTIFKAEWEIRNDDLIFHIAANRFLRGMVRAVVGSLVNIGAGKSTIADFRAIIESKDRKNAGAASPADGLFLSKVLYPEEVFL